MKKVLAAVLALGMVSVMFAGCSNAADADAVDQIKEAGEIVMVNNHAILQEVPRKMPTFFMVRPGESEE